MAASTPRPIASLTVLVVDDDPIQLEVVRERLSQAGHTVEVRDQAIGTSEWVLEHRPRVVLLDEQMPALNGSTLAQILVKRGVNTAIILHSGRSREELAELVKTSGAAGAIPKTSSDVAFMREFDRLVARLR